MHCSILATKILYLLFNIATDEDFFLSSDMPLTFASGSRNGTEVCVSLAANTDDEVECEEDFTVLLALLTPGNNLNLVNTATAIKIVDTNGIQNCTQRPVFECLRFLAASFDINATATVVEDNTLMVCAEMFSGGATLSKEVIVTVSTTEGSGNTGVKLRFSKIKRPGTFSNNTKGSMRRGQKWQNFNC